MIWMACAFAVAAVWFVLLAIAFHKDEINRPFDWEQEDIF